MPATPLSASSSNRSLPRGAPLIGPLTPQLFRPDAQRPLRGKPVSYTHLTLPTNREV